jgi:hypothetical protein
MIFQCTECPTRIHSDRKPAFCWICTGKLKPYEPPVNRFFKCPVCQWEYTAGYTVDTVMCIGDAKAQPHDPQAMDLLQIVPVYEEPYQ